MQKSSVLSVSLPIFTHGRVHDRQHRMKNSSDMSYPLGLRITLLAALLLISSCVVAAPPDLGQLRVPPGFSISIFSSQVPGARSMSIAPDGTVYVGTLTEGKVYGLRDTDHDGTADEIVTLASGLDHPNGVAFHAGDLFIAEVSRISVIRDVGAHWQTPVTPSRVYDGYPTDHHHGWKYLRTGPDGRLYTAVGAPCNVCENDRDIYATLTRLNPDGKGFEIIARGLRNSEGFDWHPATHELWLTDNGRDWLGDDRPPDELNHASRPGLHFGFPYCFGKDIPDPDFGSPTACATHQPPEWEFPAHVAALGMHFHTGTRFPAEYRNQLFVAQHGSWNRSTPQGYRLALIRFADGKPVSEQAFAEGWLRPDGTVTGRPVDVAELPDGALLVSDDLNGIIYRITPAK